MRRNSIVHEFVEFVPRNLQDGVVYVSIPYRIAVHRCCCGCGSKVVTPLDPTEWKLVFDGDSVTLDPSIGNWSFPCKSHYWIRNDRVVWDRTFSSHEIERVRELAGVQVSQIPEARDRSTRRGWFARLFRGRTKGEDK